MHDGLLRAVDDAEEQARFRGSSPARASAADAVPPWLLLETLERLGGLLP